MLPEPEMQLKRMEARNEQSRTHTQHAQGLDASRYGGSFVGEDAHDGHWEYPQEHPQGHRWTLLPWRVARLIMGTTASRWSAPRRLEVRVEAVEANATRGDEHEVGDGSHHVGGCQFA